MCAVLGIAVYPKLDYALHTAKKRGFSLRSNVLLQKVQRLHSGVQRLHTDFENPTQKIPKPPNCI
jgi:hypothetical protein